MKVELYETDKAAERLGPNKYMQALLRHAGGATLLFATGLWVDKAGKIQDEGVRVHQVYTDAKGLKLAHAAAVALLATGEEAVLLVVDGVPEFIRA